MKNIKIKEMFTGICCKTSEAHNAIKPGNYYHYKIIEITKVPPEISTKEVISRYKTTIIANNIYCIDFKSLGPHKIISH